MSSVITILKIKVSLHSHWELQSSNPEKGPKSKENDPPPPIIRKLDTDVICFLFLSNFAETSAQLNEE